ncbi:hypothetical protein SAMN04488090_0289 [Siphonobacter aquaeclarae]|uniref:Long-chain fatty acid transport protein n=2 Tax=Siphonobacter aquaeclarae TaxID=563176 RepID=A0A1G9I0P6_9BACT|nr:hypothetical protein SAMN04488090_0289 [Siphonobacter aquaeclarae]
MVAAQDTHYWSSQFNPGGFVMPGATVADTRDSGVFFFNPALLAFRPQRSISVSGNIYQYATLKIREGTGVHKPLVSSGTGIYPSMLAGSVPIKRGRVVMAYGLLHHYILSYKVTQRQDKHMDVLDNAYSPGSETFIGQYAAQNLINETSGLLSAAVRLKPSLTAGITLEGIMRKQFLDEEVSARALVNTGSTTDFLPLTNVESVYRVEYTSIGVRPRLGLAYNRDRHHFGLTVSLPLLKLSGRGTLVSDNLVTNLVLGAGLSPLNLLANTRQEKLHIRYKSPVSIAAGYTFDYGKGQLFAAAEWFAGLKEYAILTPRNEYYIRPDTAQISGEGLLTLRDARRPVVNAALGITFPVTERIQGYAAARTDFTYTDRSRFSVPDGHTPYTSYWNNYHLQVGANIRKKKMEVRPCLMFTYGGMNGYTQPVNFDTPNESNLLLGEQGVSRASYFVAGFQLSYIHAL